MSLVLLLLLLTHLFCCTHMHLFVCVVVVNGVCFCVFTQTFAYKRMQLLNARFQLHKLLNLEKVCVCGHTVGPAVCSVHWRCHMAMDVIMFYVCPAAVVVGRRKP